MTASKTGTTNADLVLAELIDEIMTQQRRGEPVSLADYAARYPDHVQQLQELLPALSALANLSQSVCPEGIPGSLAAGESHPDRTEELGRGTLGDFRILREIGRGGMGVVYEVEQISLGRRMALKVLPFAGVLDERQLTRFRNEARAAASLEHPNIVRVHSVGCERGVHYYATQYIEGRTLAQVINELRAFSPLPPGEGQGVRAAESGQQAAPPCHPVTPSLGSAETQPVARVETSTPKSGGTREFFRQVANWGIQAAEGLEHAHQMGIVHRDIKPSNLLVEFRLPSPAGGRGAGGEGRGAGVEGLHLWITDFGLAMTHTDPALTMTGDILGTLRYMSPEQASGRSRVTDHHTDIYSLGVTLYELLTLRPLFAGDDRQSILRQIASDDPPPPRRLNRSIPRDLETIVLKATAKEPSQRYTSAQEMADDLKRFLADEPIQAKRAGPVVRLKKWTKRHKAVTGVVAALLAAAAIFSTVTAVQAYQREVRSTATATEGLADVRLAMAQKEFGQAQRRATELQAELAAAPKLKARFGPELEDLLHQAEVRLRLQRFQKLAEEARFSANRLLTQWWAKDHTDPRRRCQEALAVLHVLDNDRWLQDLEQLPLDRTEVSKIKQSVAETLFLSAIVEADREDAPAARRAIELLDRVETLAPSLRVLYEHRGRYRSILGEDDKARGDLQRASTMQANT